MGRKCSICNHPSRDDIDQALLSDQTYQALAQQYNVSLSSLGRHKKHLLLQRNQAIQAQNQAAADEQVRRLIDMEAAAQQISLAALESENYELALKGLRETVRIITATAKIRAELNPTWDTLTDIIREALMPFPQARMAVVTAIKKACDYVPNYF
jgi:hypothetical protein